jgi:hypothetical protein
MAVVRKYDLFAPYEFNLQAFIPRFTICALSGISSSWRFIFGALACANLALIKSWGLLFGCIIVLAINYELSKKIGMYTIDIILNLITIFALTDLIKDIHWRYPLHMDYRGIYITAIIIWGIIKGQKGIQILTYARGLKSLERSGKIEQGHFWAGERNERLVFKLNTREAAIFIRYFNRDPLAHLMRMHSMAPLNIPVEHRYDIDGNILVCNNIISGEQSQRKITIRIMRIRRTKFLIRVEGESIDWYKAANKKYVDFM